MKMLALTCLALCLMPLSRVWSADTYYLFKAAVAIPVTRVEEGNAVDRLLVKTLVSNDLINLSQGRPLGTRVDPKAELLAVAVIAEAAGSVASPRPRLVVIKPTSDPATFEVKVTVATLQALDFTAISAPTKFTGQGTGTLQFVETTTGDIPSNKLFATTITGAGKATKGVAATADAFAAFSFSLTSFTGRIHFSYTDTRHPTALDYDGVALKGKISTTGKVLGTVDL